MFYKKLSVLFIVPVFIALSLANSAQARSRLVPVYMPDTINYGKVSQAQVSKRLRATLVRRRWAVKRVSGSHIRATYKRSSSKRTLMASVNIKYSGGKMRFSYNDSEGFSYDAEAGLIHRKYNSWVKNIEQDLRVEFSDY